MVKIEVVKTWKQRREFVDFPNRLYKGVKEYLPSLYSEAMASMNPRKNFAYEFCEARFWLAKQSGKTVGRIGGIINHRANEKWNKKQMRFWQCDFIDDSEVSSALFDVVERWAGEKGCTEVAGPLGFTDLDLEGMLVDGFDETGVFITYYNYPYYLKHLENLGYVKDVDWVEYKMLIPEKKKDIDILARMSEFSQRVYKLHLKEFTHVRDIIDSAAPELLNLINISYRDLYSTTDMDMEQGIEYFKDFEIVLNLKTSAFVYNESDEMVGFVLAIPDISAAVKKSRGKLLLFGWLRILRAIRKNDEYIALLIGVHPEYRSKGVITILLSRLMEGFMEEGAVTCRICPMLEENSNVLSLMNIVPTEPYRRRRCLVKKI